MGKSWEARLVVKPKLTSAILFLCTAASIAWACLDGVPSPFGPDGTPPIEIAAEASPLAFLCAGVLVFFRPRSGYGLGLAAGLVALPWFVRTELSLAPWNSWIFLNQEGGFPAFVKLNILSVALIAIAVSCSCLRLLPARWSLRGAPLHRRTWPAFAVGILVLAVWFVHSVTPYSIPAYDHGSKAEFRILHVQKRGLRFYETRVMEYRNGLVWVLRSERRLFQYRFDGRMTQTALGETSLLERARTLVQSPELWKLHTPPARALRWWDAEGWYVVLKDSRLLAFTSEYRTPPPQEVTDLFHEIEKLPARESMPVAMRDVCLGFCYDPVAALGFTVLQQRARLLSRSASGAGAGF
jgi:hypothetical protein